MMGKLRCMALLCPRMASPGLLMLSTPKIGPRQPQSWRALGQGQGNIEQTSDFRYRQLSQPGRNRLSLLCLIPYRCQPGLSHHRQDNIPMSTVPMTHLILIEPRLSLSLLDALLDSTACRGHLSQAQQRHLHCRIG